LQTALLANGRRLSRDGDSIMTMEIPDNVLAAIRSVVEYNYFSTSGDDGEISGDWPVIRDWLEEVGMFSPYETEVSYAARKR
jgi:hypothetical protein